MLKKLKISNFAIIENVELEFQNHLTVITGETGSGKSILLGALNLLLGERADYSVIRDKNAKTVVEGHWQITADFRSFFIEHDLDFDTTTLIRREISSEGKSRAFINDTPVNLNIIKSLTSRLIHIHSQHNTLELRDKNFQLGIVDILGNHGQELALYTQTFGVYNEEEKRLSQLKTELSKVIQERDYVQFQIDELNKLELDKTNYEDIEAQIKALENAESLIRNTTESLGLLDNPSGILPTLNKAKLSLQKITPYAKVLDDVYNRIISAEIELKDISQELESFAESITMNPEQLNYLNHKLSGYQRALIKHGLDSQAELLLVFHNLQSKSSATENLEFEILKTEQKVSDSLKELNIAGNSLTASRKQAGQDVELKIQPYLERLKLNDALISFQIKPKEHFDSSGFDHVDLLFSTNRGMTPMPLEKVASGGELGRLMLILMTLISERKSLPTVIFDEIDTGVSGDVADRIGQLLREMGKNRQLLSITHLPQVAAAGFQHMSVRKKIVNNQSTTTVVKLNIEDRKLEIAQLLSGEQITEAAMNNANVLLMQHD